MMIHYKATILERYRDTLKLRTYIFHKSYM